MTGTITILIYLLIGAILGWKEHTIFEDVIKDTMVRVPMNLRGIFISLSTILIITLAPLVGLYSLILMLKPKRKKS